MRREKEGRDESVGVWPAGKGSGVWGERRKKMERKNKIKSMGPCVSLGGEKRVEEWGGQKNEGGQQSGAGGREMVEKRKKEIEERRKKWGGKSWEFGGKAGGQNGDKHKNEGKGKWGGAAMWEEWEEREENGGVVGE